MLNLFCTEPKCLGMSDKRLKEIMRTEIRSPKTMSMIARLHWQCREGAEVSKVDNIKRKIVGVVQGPLRTFRGTYH